MTDYSITFARSARKELEALPNQLLLGFSQKLNLYPQSRVQPAAKNFKEIQIFGESESVIIVLFIQLTM
jgi:hypothetical protein